MTPIYQFSIGNDAIQGRLEKFQIQDVAMSHGDTLTIKINGEGLAKPSMGVVMNIKIGYEETSVWDAGTYIIQEVNRIESAAGQANLLTIKGISHPQCDTAHADVHLTSEQRIFQKQTFGQIATHVIKAVGLNPRVHKDLADIPMPVTIQRAESDAAFLDRISREHDAFMKVHSNDVIIQPFDTESIGTLTLARNQIMKYEFNEVQFNNIKKVVCKYGDLTAGKTERVAVGIGANGLVVPTTYPDEITARHAATAILRSFQRRLYTINVHCLLYTSPSPRDS